MSKKDSLKLLHLTWEDVQSLTEKVADLVLNSNFNPDIIVAISRGGFNPARILCDELSVQKLASVQIEFYVGVNMKTSIPRIIIPLNANVKGLRVLVVDDVSDSGESLQVALEHVNSKGPSEVRVATLHIKSWTSYHPHYYAKEVDSWIVYPWEPLESVRNISEHLKNDGFSQCDILSRLLELGFSLKVIERAYGS